MMLLVVLIVKFEVIGSTVSIVVSILSMTFMYVQSPRFFSI